ncbi:MAG: hypothetical protein ABI476_00240 [Oxalobacteraceae bacterium]
MKIDCLISREGEKNGNSSQKASSEKTGRQIGRACKKTSGSKTSR